MTTLVLDPKVTTTTSTTATVIAPTSTANCVTCDAAIVLKKKNLDDDFVVTDDAKVSSGDDDADEDDDELYPLSTIPNGIDSYRYQDELNDIVQAWYELVTEEEIQAFQNFVESISHEKVAEHAVHCPEKAPDFVLQDQAGDTVHLYDILEKQQRPVVLVFYRGRWCPHCNATLMMLQRILQEIQKMGATLIALSPMHPDGTQLVATKRDLRFSVCSDIGNEVARQYKVVFTMKPEFRSYFQTWQEDISEYNADASWDSPLPATYVIKTDGTISWSFIDNDPGIRAGPQDILNAIAATFHNTNKRKKKNASDSNKDDEEDEVSVSTLGSYASASATTNNHPNDEDGDGFISTPYEDARQELPTSPRSLTSLRSTKRKNRKYKRRFSFPAKGAITNPSQTYLSLGVTMVNPKRKNDDKSNKNQNKKQGLFGKLKQSAPEFLSQYFK